MILHENKTLRTGKFLLLSFKTLLGVIVIGYRSILIDRISCLVPDISDHAVKPAAELPDTFFHIPVFRQQGKESLVDLFIAAPHFHRMAVHTDHQV